jgi:hypothetical protein
MGTVRLTAQILSLGNNQMIGNGIPSGGKTVLVPQ